MLKVEFVQVSFECSVEDARKVEFNTRDEFIGLLVNMSPRAFKNLVLFISSLNSDGFVEVFFEKEVGSLRGTARMRPSRLRDASFCNKVFSKKQMSDLCSEIKLAGLGIVDVDWDMGVVSFSDEQASYITSRFISCLRSACSLQKDLFLKAKKESFEITISDESGIHDLDFDEGVYILSEFRSEMIFMD